MSLSDKKLLPVIQPLNITDKVFLRKRTTKPSYHYVQQTHKMKWSSRLLNWDIFSPADLPQNTRETLPYGLDIYIY